MNRSAIIKILRRITRDESGSQLVEFSMSIMAILALVFGIMDFSRAVYSYHFVDYAAQQAARYAVVRGSGWTSSCSTSAPPNFNMNFGCQAAPSDVQNYVRSIALPLINVSDVTASTTWNGTKPGGGACSTPNSQGCYVKVSVNYHFAFFMPFLPRSAGFTMSGSSQRVIQQ